MDTTLFSTRGGKAPPADTINHAGGEAYELSLKEKLAKYCATGMFADTFYVSAKAQLDEVLGICKTLDDPMFVAKCAVYSRKYGYLRDMPAFLLAVVMSMATRKFDDNNGRRGLRAAFPLVVDNGKMLRNFVQVVRSGVTGRKDFGTMPKQLIKAWLEGRTPGQLLRDQIGQSPDLSDVIKMVHPRPRDAEVAATIQYLTGPAECVHRPRKKLPDGTSVVDMLRVQELARKQERLRLPFDFDEAKGEVRRTRYDVRDLPPLIAEYEKFKAAKLAGRKPDFDLLSTFRYDFRLLDSLGLTPTEWKQVARTAPWKMTRMNLNTFQRHGVLDDPEMVELIAKRIEDPREVHGARCFPYELMTAFQNVDTAIPMRLQFALQNALEIATDNVPEFGGGAIVVCPDVSGSMGNFVYQAKRGQPQPKTRCVDVAALMTAVILRRAPNAIVLPFADALRLDLRLNPRDSINTIATRIASAHGGGTECGLPLRWLNDNRKTDVEAVIFISDYESWIKRNNGYGHRGTDSANEWSELKKRNPGAKMINVDVTPNTSAQVSSDASVLNIGGFSDTVFNVISTFLKHGGATHWVDEIEKIELA